MQVPNAAPPRAPPRTPGAARGRGNGRRRRKPVPQRPRRRPEAGAAAPTRGRTKKRAGGKGPSLRPKPRRTASTVLERDQHHGRRARARDPSRPLRGQERLIADRAAAVKAGSAATPRRRPETSPASRAVSPVSADAALLRSHPVPSCGAGPRRRMGYRPPQRPVRAGSGTPERHDAPIRTRLR